MLPIRSQFTLVGTKLHYVAMAGLLRLEKQDGAHDILTDVHAYVRMRRIHLRKVRIGYLVTSMLVAECCIQCLGTRATDIFFCNRVVG
jgi:hypothetical protein